MSHRLPVGSLLLVLSLAFAVPSAAVAEDEASAEAKAADLVARAFEASAAGDQAKRRALLEEAVKASAACAVAHWQLGHVQDSGKWQAAAGLAGQLAKDDRYADYRNLRDANAGIAGGQLLLARWCQKRGLAAEEKLHWQTLLLLSPANREAIKSLGLHKHAGQWLTAEQIDAVKRSQRTTEEARDFWKPKLERWAETIDRDLNGRDDAVAQLQAIKELAAIPWLEAYVSQRSEQLGVIVVCLLAQLDQPAATQSLVRHALASEFSEVRTAAIKELSRRRWDEFLGPLVESLTSPPEVSMRSSVISAQSTRRQPNAYTQVVNVHTEGIAGEVELEDSLSLYTGGAYGLRLGIYWSREFTAAEAAQSRGRAEAIAARAAALERRNIRICELLEQVTSQPFGRDQKKWWQWWLDYSDQYVPSQKPVYKFAYAQSHSGGFSLDPYSCFAPDTPVHTRCGLRRIEQLQPGDLVLSQHAESGELAYRPVLQTTVRPAKSLLTITVAGERLQVTRGHFFWEVGQGWKMARQLSPGDQLQLLGETAAVTSIEESSQKESPVHNLVVADFSTYFVGRNGVLAHDHSARRPTQSLVPGLKAPESIR